MLIKTKKHLVNVILLLPPLIFTACNGGGGGSAGTQIRGNIAVANANSNADVVLGGTHQYTVSLANATDLPYTVMVAVTSSNTNVATIESNTCTTVKLAAPNEMNHDCTFYVVAHNSGSTNITISSPNYPVITEPLNVARQWGTFSGVVEYDKYHTNIIQVAFQGEDVYGVSEYGYAIKSSGYAWQDIGHGKFITDKFSNYPYIVVDQSHVCVSLDYNGEVKSEVKCSSNGSAWQTLPIIDGMWIWENMSLYQGNLYILALSFTTGTYQMLHCPVDDCTSWQQQGQPFVSDEMIGVLYNSTPYVLNSDGVHYQESDGSWHLYGSYPNTIADENVLAANSKGVAIANFVSTAPQPYSQPIYFNNTVGGTFATIGGNVQINDPAYIMNQLVFADNSLFALLGDGNIYVSNNNNNSWSSWIRVGTNNIPFNYLGINGNKIYGIKRYTESWGGGSQIYVYSLD